jgi:hypothetical protein
MMGLIKPTEHNRELPAANEERRGKKGGKKEEVLSHVVEIAPNPNYPIV